jgi:hypothetical protein
VSGKELLAAVRSAPVTPELVVLAARDTDLLAADLAAAVPTVVGFRGRVSDAACVEFVRAFYLALAAGLTVEEAAAAGRSSTFRAADAQPAEWALPVVYTTPEHRLMLPPPPLPTSAPERPGLVLESRPAETGQPESGQPESVQLETPPLPETSAPEAERSLEQLMAETNLQALAARWGPVPRALWPQLVRDQEARLRSRLPDAAPLQLVTR